MSTQPLDTLIRIETPEGIELQADLAGPVVRMQAYAVDIVLKIIIVSIFGLLLLIVSANDSSGYTEYGIWLIFSFLLEWFYPVYFEIRRSGQTPGKKLFGIAVVSANLRPVGFSASIVRNLLRTADLMPFLYLGGLSFMFFTPRFQRLGDIAADTIVVYRPKPVAVLEKDEGDAIPPPGGTTFADQLAILEYSERSKDFSAERSEELANILSSALGEKDGKTTAEKLRAMARWIKGEK